MGGVQALGGYVIIGGARDVEVRGVRGLSMCGEL